ncbi:hypothetical protein A2U01_0100279, partial [Trifolium medium]|nr:hypothetical protein [Trifolium medium]
ATQCLKVEISNIDQKSDRVWRCSVPTPVKWNGVVYLQVLRRSSQ